MNLAYAYDQVARQHRRHRNATEAEKIILKAAHDLPVLAELFIRASEGRLPMDQVVETAWAVLDVCGLTPCHGANHEGPR